MERIETVVIGAGVIGLACAKILAESRREVIVLEASAGICHMSWDASAVNLEWGVSMGSVLSF